MRAAVAAVLLIVAVVVARADITPLDDDPGPQHLQIHNDHIVTLRVGSFPGKWLRFRVRNDASRIYVFQHPSPYSNTWTPLPDPDEYGQSMVCDTLSIGTAHVRADIVVGAFVGETSATVEGAQAEGVLGLSALSPLWMIWRNFTRTRDSLYLGQTLRRASVRSPVALAAELTPSWLYGVGQYPASFVVEYRATLSASAVASLRGACMQQLGEVVDESVELAGTGDALAAILGVEAGEHLCRVDTEYRLLLMPESDYNIVPSVLLMHHLGRPPVFEIRSLHDGGNDTTTFSAVLFNRYDDSYVEVDTTNAAGTGVRRLANRPRPGNTNTIVLGSYGVRRFEMTFLLDAQLAYISVRHNGLSAEGQRRITNESAEVQRVRDLSALVAGLLLWALLAVEPDPVLPGHARQARKRFAHAQRDQISLRVRVPVAAAAAATTAVSSSSDTFIQADPDGTVRVVFPIAAGPPNQSSPPPPSTTKQQPSTTAQLNRLVAETAIRVAFTLRAAFNMQSEWPVDSGTLMFVQFIVECIVALYFVLAMAFYDTAWALSLVLSRNATTDALGWTTLALLIAALAAFSVVAALCAGRDARIGSLALQLELLIGLYTLMISLYQWDLALALLFVLTAVSGVVLMCLMMSAWDVVPQYGRRGRALHTQLRPIALLSCGPWFLYITFALLPFIVRRLWDNDSHSHAMSAYVMLAAVVTIGAYLTVQPFVYPLLVAGVALERIIDGYNARRSAITGQQASGD